MSSRLPADGQVQQVVDIRRMVLTLTSDSTTYGTALLVMSRNGLSRGSRITSIVLSSFSSDDGDAGHHGGDEQHDHTHDTFARNCKSTYQLWIVQHVGFHFHAIGQHLFAPHFLLDNPG